MMMYSTRSILPKEENFENNSSDCFAGIFENRPIKIVGVSISVTSSLFYILIIYSIIWFEHFGSDKKRTILNKLVSSICACSIFWFSIIQPIEMTRYVFGPLPQWLCLFHFVIKNIVGIQLLLFFSAISVLRYLFIFHLKNPSCFENDFWTSYLNIWVITFSVLSQVVHSLLPGRQPMNFYICSGICPDSSDVAFAKVNYVLIGTHVFSFLAHIVVRLKIFVFKWSSSTSNGGCVTSKFVTNFENQSLSDFTTNIAMVVLMGFATVTVTIVNNLKPEEANIYPDYLYVYQLHIYGPFVFGGFLPMVYYLRHKPLQTVMFREQRDLLIRVFPQCTEYFDL